MPGGWNRQAFHGTVGQFADAAILLGFCAVLMFFANWVAKERWKAIEFLNWIKSKQEELKKGWAYYDNQNIKRSL